MPRVVYYKKNIILVNKLTFLLTGAFLLAKIVVLPIFDCFTKEGRTHGPTHPLIEMRGASKNWSDFSELQSEKSHTLAAIRA